MCPIDFFTYRWNLGYTPPLLLKSVVVCVRIQMLKNKLQVPTNHTGKVLSSRSTFYSLTPIPVLRGNCYIDESPRVSPQSNFKLQHCLEHVVHKSTNAVNNIRQILQSVRALKSAHDGIHFHMVVNEVTYTRILSLGFGRTSYATGSSQPYSLKSDKL